MKRLETIESKNVVKNLNGMKYYDTERLATDLLLYAEAALSGFLIYFKTKGGKRYSWYRIGYASCNDFEHFAEMFIALGYKVDDCRIRLSASCSGVVFSAHREIVEFMLLEGMLTAEEYNSLRKRTPIEVTI